MQNVKLTKEKILILLIVILLGYILNQRQCNRINDMHVGKPKITVVRDTIWQTKVDTFRVQTEKFKTVYVPLADNAQEREIIVREEREVMKQEKHLFQEAREYRDTLQNENVEIYSYGLIKGELLKANLSYKLKVPREISTTKIIEYPSRYRSGLYAFGEAGGNQQQFDNISIGLQYNRKGKWFVSYRLNFNELSNTTHNVSFGIRLK